MQKRTLLIHGTHGYPDENWNAPVTRALETAGHIVFRPQFPTPPAPPQGELPTLFTPAQNPGTWTETLQGIFPRPEDRIFNVVMSHSIGTAAQLHFMQSGLLRAENSFFIASAIKPLKTEQFAALCNPFLTDKDGAPVDWQWDRIKENAGRVFVIHGDDDPWCPLEDAKELSRHLEAAFLSIPDGGHLNAGAGFDLRNGFPLLASLVIKAAATPLHSPAPEPHA